MDDNKSTSTEPEPFDEKERFLIDLEFIQNLSNPAYLHFLAQNRYYEDAEFLNYLNYLKYWKQPEYIKHLLFPQCLQFLDELTDNHSFRRELAMQSFRDFVHQQQGYHWLYDADITPSSQSAETSTILSLEDS
mmetsp:Transcript_3951/g.4035  ORF Transcript_3951/g.4035 Transcript_3951/m.4035 type:complete len:133 (+) Transcript_3951:190-588(+)